jgi:hypothetical protein
MSEPVVRRSLRLHRTACSATAKPMAGTVVFDVPELLTEIIEQCSWASRVNLSHTTVRARLTVQASIRQRIHNMLKPFIYDLSTFFTLIHEIQAAIVGSAAWNVMTMDDVGPRDLNIVVPNGSVYGMERLKAFLSCSGTTVTLDGSAGIVYESCASRFIKLNVKTVSLDGSICVT